MFWSNNQSLIVLYAKKIHSTQKKILKKFQRMVDRPACPVRRIESDDNSNLSFGYRSTIRINTQI